MEAEERTSGRAAAEQALATHVGAPLGLEAPWPAAGVSEIVEENMANAARVHAIERGKVIGRHAMIAFGGGAPLHAGRLAEKLGIRTVVVPGGAGVGSALGFLQGPVLYEVVPLFLLVQSFRQAGLLIVLTAVVGRVVPMIAQNADYNTWMGINGQWMVWLVYLPCTALVLFRPNEGFTFERPNRLLDLLYVPRA